MAQADLTAVGEVLVDRVESRNYPGGSPFNVALAAARLGLAVDLVGRVGADELGDLLRDRAQQSGVGVAHLETADQPTSIASATLDEHGRAHYEFDFETSAGLRFSDQTLARVPLGRVLQTGSIAGWHPLSSGPVLAMQRRAHASGVLVSFDPNPRPSLIGDLRPIRDRVAEGVRAAHVVKASDDDMAVLHPDLSPAQIADDWCSLGATLVLVTRGPQGVVAYSAAGEVAAVPAPRISVVDTVGAGDAFTGGFVAALCETDLASPDALRVAVETRSDALVHALEHAVLVSAMTCERAGADPPTSDELRSRRAAL